MKNLMKLISITALALSFVLIGSTHAFAKAHDQGVSDGSRDPGSQVGHRGVGQGGVAGNVKGGVRGEAASAAGADNSGSNGSIGRGNDR